MHHHVLAGATGSFASLPGPACACSKRSPLAEGSQRKVVGIGSHHDIPSTPTVTAVGSTRRHVLLAPEAQRSSAAAARGDVEVDLVEEDAAGTPALSQPPAPAPRR
jgi:hypothetical protein